MTDREMGELLAQQLYTPIFTKLTVTAGCMVWGFDRIVDLLLHNQDDTHLIEAIVVSNIIKFKQRMPIVEVDEATMRKYIATKQVASWDRVSELKSDIKASINRSRE
jgi:hypothetical protein